MFITSDGEIWIGTRLSTFVYVRKFLFFKKITICTERRLEGRGSITAETD